ncbi:MAG: DHH family phosphoesterase [Thaumarchaeota archaeon]|nr:DHH family phosphoesterase [Nitrososphaerota archaeon]
MRPVVVSMEPLKARFDSVARGLLDLAASGRRILVVTHIDADGILSGSMVFSSLAKKGANVVLRCIPDLDPGLISELASQRYDFYVFTDLGSALVRELESGLGQRFLVIDHHQLAEEDMKKAAVVNAWDFGLDGGREACSSSMAYEFALSVDPSNRDLSPLAVVGAVADRQDGGPDRSLTGLNKMALEDAVADGLARVSKDLLFIGRETRPVHESVALTSTPYLKGVTGNKEGILSSLHQSGLVLKEGASWRTLSTLTEDEKKKVTEVVAGLVASSGGNTGSIAELVGDAITLAGEDAFTPLRDVREFGTLLNACGRMGEPGTGVSVCLGDRGNSLAAAMAILSQYRMGIGRALQALSEDPARITASGWLVFVHGDGVIEDKLLGPVISILTSSPGYTDKIVVGLTKSGESDLKVSSRVGDAHQGEVNLGVVMRAAGEAVRGVGGGHSMAAGAKIPATEAEAFERMVVEMLAG